MKVLGTKILLDLIPGKQSMFELTPTRPTTGAIKDLGPTAIEYGLRIGDTVVFDSSAPIDVGCGSVIDYSQVITILERELDELS